MKKRILLTLLMVALLVSVAVFTAQAEGEATCPHCGVKISKIEWTNFNAATFKANNGHYKMTADVNRTTVAMTLDGAATDVVLDLQGKNFNTTKTQAFVVPAGKTLTILDSVGGGTVNGTAVSSGKTGGVYQVSGTLNLYGGRSYTNTAVSITGSVAYVAAGGELNIYEGATLDGSTVTLGSGACGTVYSLGTVKMNGGSVIGASAGSGGSIYVGGGSLTVSGGTISGGQAKNYGDDIYVAANKSVPVSFQGGNVKGEIQVDAGNTLTVSGTAKLENLLIGTLKLTLGVLTDGANIAVRVADETEAFTVANENAKTYMEKGYIRAYALHKEVACNNDNTLSIVDYVCPCCDAVPVWTAFEGTVETGKHYYLTEDYNNGISVGTTSDTTVEITLDLNGFSVITTNARTFMVRGELNLVDSAGAGGARSSASGSNGSVFSVQATGTLNLYGGTYTSDATPGKGSVIYALGAVNIHGATLDASQAVDTTKACSPLYINGGDVVMYSGTILGATAKSGGSVHIEKGNFTMKDGTISGGEATTGAEIYAYNANSAIAFEGGTVEGEVLLSPVASISLSGKPVLKDLKINSTLVTLGELTDGADITIGAAEGEGVFTLENANAKDYAKYFTSSNQDLIVAVEGNALALREPVLCPHCDTPMNQITWTAFNAGTAKTTSGHYYLTAKVNRTQGQFIQECEDLVIDLRGFDFTCPGNRAFLVNAGLSLSVIDTVGGGSVSGTGTGNGGVYNVAGTLNLYSGTSAALADATKGSVVYVAEGGLVNIYEGATLEGNEKTGSAVYLLGKGEMTGGTVQNGKADFGGNVYVASTGEFTMSGGTVQNGVPTNTNTNYQGGADNIYLDGGKMTMSGGSIMVESSAIRGDAILGRNGATLQLTAENASAYNADMRGNVLVDSSCIFETKVGATVVNRYNRQFWYNSNFQAINNYEKIPDYRYIKVYTGSTVQATKNLVLDINGFELKLIVDEGVTAEVLDSTATLEAAGTGKVTLEGDGTLASSCLRSDLRYVALVQEGKYTFHPMTLKVHSLSLRTSSAGIYYKTKIECDDILGAAIENYGVALSLNQMPGADFATDDHSLYTQIATENFENGEYTSAIINHILKDNAPNNAQRGEIKIYANSYVTVNVDGTNTAVILSDTDNPGMTTEDEEFDGVAYSLKDVLASMDKDENWAKLSEEHQQQLLSFYEKWFTKGIEDWTFNNIRVTQVGFSRVDITPNFEVHIAGGSVNDRVSEGVMDPVYATCIAVTDPQGETVLLFTQDLVGAAKNYTTKARSEISKATGVPVENIFLSATHTHSAPDTANNDLTNVQTYREFYFEKIVEAAQEALADRSGAVASMGSAVAKTEDGKSMVFVRRYIQASGGYEGGNNHIEGDTLVDHVYDANEGMQIINFHRPASDKKDVLFTNLGVHATFNGATTQVMLSADFPAGVRQQVEASGEYLSAHFISAGADQNPTSKLDDEQHNLTYMQYGQRIGQIALDCVDELGAVQLGAATVKSQTVTADGNIEDILLNKEAGVHDIKLYTAELVQTYFNNRDFSKADQVAKNIGFKGIYDAIGYIKRSNMAETREITVSTLVLGDLAFVLAPYEMFGGSAAELLEASPYENTFIITCCNGADGYVPKAGTYAYGCYESYTSYVAEGTAEVLVNTFVDLLKATKNG